MLLYQEFNMHRFLLIFGIALAAGCATGPKYEVSQEWDQATLASVTIYRTKTFYHSANPERPFFYIDGLLVGKLGTGQDITTKVVAGKHIITVRESLLFMPAYENGRVEGEFEAGKSYYLRYSKEFSGIDSVGSTLVATGSTNFSIADEGSYLLRQ